MLLIVPAISEYYPDIAANDNKNIFKIVSRRTFPLGPSFASDLRNMTVSMRRNTDGIVGKYRNGFVQQSLYK